MSVQPPKKPLNSSDPDIAKFNHNMGLLLYQLSKAYPEDHDLKVWSDKFEWSKSFNVRVVCDYFITLSEKYIKEIMTEDTAFFLTMDYTNATDNSEYIRLFHKIIEVWSESADERLKKNIWKYFQTLVTYGIKATKRKDLLPILNRYRKTPLVF